MPTLSDYSSILEIGFGLNLAVSYINMFVSPALKRAENEIARFSWWVENPERLQAIGGKKLAPAEFEDALSNWLYDAGRMRRAIERHQRFPTYSAFFASVALFVGLLFPDLEVGKIELSVVVALSIGPVVLGSLYLWYRTKKERRAERKACDVANKLFIIGNK